MTEPTLPRKSRLGSSGSREPRRPAHLDTTLKRLVLPLVILTLWVGTSAQAYTHPSYEGRSLYVVVASVGGQDARNVPTAQIRRYDYPPGTWPAGEAPHAWGDISQKVKGVHPEVVHDFKATEIELIKVFHEQGIVVMAGVFEGGMGGELRVIRAENPAQVERYGHPEGLALGDIHFYEIEGRVKAGVRFSEEEGGESDGLALVDLNTLAVTCDVPADLRRYQVADQGETMQSLQPGLSGFPVTLDEFRKLGFGPEPPQGMWGEQESRLVLYNGKDDLLVDGGRDTLARDSRGMYHTWHYEDRVLPGRRILHLRRNEGVWTQYVLKGDQSRMEVVGPWLTWRVGWSHPESEFYRQPAFTGEWTMVRLDARKCSNVYFHGRYSNHARVLFAAEYFLLVAAEHDVSIWSVLDLGNLVEIDRHWGGTIFEDEDAPHIQAIFFGPRGDKGEETKPRASETPAN